MALSSNPMAKQPNTIETIINRISLGEDWRSTCWLFPLKPSQSAPTIKLHSKETIVHRLLYQIFRYTITPYDELQRLCGYEDCVNPAHFELFPIDTLPPNKLWNEQKREVLKYKQPFTISIHPADLLYPNRRTIPLQGGYTYRSDALKTIEQYYGLANIRHQFHQTYEPDLPPFMTFSKIQNLYKELTQEKEQFQNLLTLEERREFSRLMANQVRERLEIPEGRSLLPEDYARYARVSPARAAFLVERAFLLSEQTIKVEMLRGKE